MSKSLVFALLGLAFALLAIMFTGCGSSTRDVPTPTLSPAGVERIETENIIVEQIEVEGIKVKPITVKPITVTSYEDVTKYW